MITQTEMKKVNVNGVELAYVERGSGEPVVFVHGGFSDLRSWDSQVRAFSENYRAISYSLRYHYPNPWTGDGSDYSIPVHTKDLAGLIEKLEASPAHVVGTSYGGRVALHLARDRPELVRTLVLAEPSISIWLKDIPEGSILLTELMTKHFEPGMRAIEKGDLEQATRLFFDGVAGEGAFLNLPEEVRRRYMDNIRLQALPGTPAPFSREDAKKIGAPVLLLTGELSPRLWSLQIDELEKFLPKVEKAKIAGSSHGLTVSRPDEFNERVLAFLANHKNKAS